MRNKVYAITFAIVVASMTEKLLTFATLVLRLDFPNPAWLGFLRVFGEPVPPLLQIWVPHQIQTLLFYVLAALVARRIWISLRGWSWVPPVSFKGAPYYLAYISVISVMLGMVGLAVSMLIRTESGVPVKLLLLPAVFFLPLSILWTELMSLRQSNIDL